MILKSSNLLSLPRAVTDSLNNSRLPINGQVVPSCSSNKHFSTPFAAKKEPVEEARSILSSRVSLSLAVLFTAENGVNIQ